MDQILEIAKKSFFVAVITSALLGMLAAGVIISLVGLIISFT